jgi:hypothetical protein
MSEKVIAHYEGTSIMLEKDMQMISEDAERDEFEQTTLY